MKILTDVSSSYAFDELLQPCPYDHFWLLDGKMLDFRLEPLQYVEEITCQTVVMQIDNAEISVPASWFAVIIDKETSAIGCIPIMHVAPFGHDLLLFSPQDGKIVSTQPIFLGLRDEEVHVYPVVPKSCNFISPVLLQSHRGKMLHYGMIVGPNRMQMLEDLTAGDILC